MMRFDPILIYLSVEGRAIPRAITGLARASDLRIVRPADDEELVALVNRGFPACIIMDLGGDDHYIPLCRTLKRDPFSAVVPVVFFAPDATAGVVEAALNAGADEVLTADMDSSERQLRFQMLLKRNSHAVSVHPTTRLPGTAQIARDIGDRLGREEDFAVCYADLDHFKEFNDRYGYGTGDRVILVVSRILRDIVKGHAADGFIGHIGGDDFIFNLPISAMPVCCEEIIETFDELIPYQYTAEDRDVGYFLGEDRRGNMFQVPIMTISIGVVTNQRRCFSHPARVSELATEMKRYAKTLSGSVYAVDRRADRAVEAPASSHSLSDSDSHTLGGP